MGRCAHAVLTASCFFFIIFSAHSRTGERPGKRGRGGEARRARAAVAFDLGRRNGIKADSRAPSYSYELLAPSYITDRKGNGNGKAIVVVVVVLSHKNTGEVGCWRLEKQSRGAWILEVAAAMEKPRQVVRKFLARPQHEGVGAVVRRSIGR